MRTSLPFFIAILTLSSTAFAQVGSRLSSVTERDLEPPSQNLQTIDGEIVWIQGVLLGGDPTPYRDPSIPVATYEQGILDEEGQLWTILDTPKGRELRYNPELRGEFVKLKGWLYPASKIVNVKSWGDSQDHPVRVNEDIPVPERIPFKPEEAEQIESIRPAAPRTIQRDLLDSSLWEIQEGTDLSGVGDGAARSQTPLTDDTNRFQEILKDEGLIPIEPKESREGESAEGTSGGGASAGSDSARSAPRGASSPPVNTIPPPKSLNEEGEPLARPEEFDDALQQSLFE